MILLTLLLSLAHAELTEFHQVNDNIYRGSQPSAADIHWLKQQGIRTLFSLNNDRVAAIEERDSAERENLNMLWEPMGGFFGPSTMTMQNVMQELINPRWFPIYVHCEDGHSKTGLVIGEWRLRNYAWGKGKAWHEMREMGFHPLLLGLSYFFWGNQ